MEKEPKTTRARSITIDLFAVLLGVLLIVAGYGFHESSPILERFLYVLGGAFAGTSLASLFSSIAQQDPYDEILRHMRSLERLAEPGVSGDEASTQLFRHRWWVYHATVDQNQEEVWLQSVLDFSQSTTRGELSCRYNSVLGKGEFTVSAAAFKQLFVMIRRPVEDEEHPIVTVFPRATRSHAKRYAGVQIHETYVPELYRMSPVLISREKLVATPAGPGKLKGDADRERIEKLWSDSFEMKLSLHQLFRLPKLYRDRVVPDSNGAAVDSVSAAVAAPAPSDSIK